VAVFSLSLRRQAHARGGKTKEGVPPPPSLSFAIPCWREGGKKGGHKKKSPYIASPGKKEEKRRKGGACLRAEREKKEESAAKEGRRGFFTLWFSP